MRLTKISARSPPTEKPQNNRPLLRVRVYPNGNHSKTKSRDRQTPDQVSGVVHLQTVDAHVQIARKQRVKRELGEFRGDHRQQRLVERRLPEVVDVLLQAAPASDSGKRREHRRLVDVVFGFD